MPQLPIADKTTLDAINAKAGANTDAAGTTTLFARLKQIYDYLTGNLSSTVNTINTNVGSNADASSATGSVHAKIKDIKNSLPPQSSIKSVQRGFHSGNTDTNNITINISSVDPSKCFVLIDSSGGYYNNMAYEPVLVSLTATVLTVTASCYYTGSSYTSRKFSWQVIEFN